MPRKPGRKFWTKFSQDESYVVFADRDKRPTYEELTDFEKGMLWVAYEHRVHEYHYDKFIPPAKFVVFRAAENVEAAEKVVPDGLKRKEKWYRELCEKHREKLKAKDMLTRDGREIYLRQGEPVYAQVEDFQAPINHKAISNMKPEEFTPEMLDQLQELRDKVEQVYQEHGIYPDSSMFHPASGNLIFNADNQLTLLDTNRFQTSKSDYAELMNDFDVRITILNKRFGRTEESETELWRKNLVVLQLGRLSHQPSKSGLN